MGWISPTDFVDSGNVWTDETLSYDENTLTFAYVSVPSGWCDYLELTTTATTCDKVQLWVGRVNTQVSIIEVDIFYNSAWDNIYSGVIIVGSFQEYPIGSQQSVTAMRVRFYATKANRQAEIYEADFWEVGITPGWNRIEYTSEPPTPNAWNQVKREAGAGWKKILYE